MLIRAEPNALTDARDAAVKTLDFSVRLTKETLEVTSTDYGGQPNGMRAKDQV